MFLQSAYIFNYVELLNIHIASTFNDRNKIYQMVQSIQ